jgi:osomolarity two-component system sensor histidine kinase NIK1
MATSNGQNDPFLSHLVAVLSVYELGPFSAPIPRYDGPHDWQTETITRSLNTIARRMYNAEELVKSTKQDWNQGGHTKKRRSMDMDADSKPSNGRVLGLSFTTATTGSASTSSSRSGSRGARNNDTDTLDSSSMDFEMLSCDDGSEHDDSSSSGGKSSEKETPGPLMIANGNAAAAAQSGLANSRNSSSMNIDLDGLRSSTVDPAKMFAPRSSSLNQSSVPLSAPATSTLETACCPTCCRAYDGAFPPIIGNAFGGGSPVGSPQIIPPGPLTAAAFESGMSAVEELKLLKTQVQDVSRVCQAVARGDLSQKITVPVQGVVMVQLKDVINTMVSFPPLHSIHFIHSDPPPMMIVLPQFGTLIQSINTPTTG